MNKLQKVQDNMNHSTVIDNAGELLDQFDDVSEKDLLMLTSNYLNLEANKKYKFIFKGVGTMKGEGGKTVPTVELVDREGRAWINGNTVLVNELSKVTQLPCFVLVVTKDMAKSKQGTYLNMEVYVLPDTVAK